MIVHDKTRLIDDLPSHYENNHPLTGGYFLFPTVGGDY